MPVNYLNIYVFAIFGGLAATVGGIFICYTGMSETSYLVYRGMELTTRSEEHTSELQSQ